MKKVMVFIDNSYLVHEAGRHGIQINHKKFDTFREISPGTHAPIVRMEGATA